MVEVVVICSHQFDHEIHPRNVSDAMALYTVNMVQMNETLIDLGKWGKTR